MLKDRVRTSTYASFIMNSPDLFTDAVVLDVGCGTGILSLFAARAGAKRVFAVDASDIAEKAEKIVKANGFENVITYVVTSSIPSSFVLNPRSPSVFFVGRSKISHFLMA